jgi:hypothetical protein
MVKSTDPIIAQWYHYPQKSEKFQVTAIDDHFDTVEVQYFDGNIDEFELAAWYAMEAEPVATPRDWTGPMDNIERDDLTPVGTEMQREDWDAPYDEEMEKTSAGPRVPDEEQQRIADEEQQEET